MYSTDNLNPKNWVKGQEAASGPVTITVETHKKNFRKQYGTFSDKPSENITRWLEKAEIYQKAHMIPSLEMASVVCHCITGEPATKVQRMLDAPGVDYVNSDHFTEQEEQKAVKYTPFKARIDAKDEVTDGKGNTIHKKVEGRDAEPAIAPVRYQPKVAPDQCLKAYLLEIYGKRVNLTDADKFLSTFKTQKPRQTCSNYLDEFAINYENYAHMKWTLKELFGTPEKKATPSTEKVDAIPGNTEIRQAEMLRLVADGLCSEFKTHCDNTQFDLTQKTYIEIEKQVMYWQKSTITGKKFTASCILAKPTNSATVAAAEFDQELEQVENNDNTEESFTSSTQSSQQSSRGQGRGRGNSRGGRGRGGRGRGASTGRPQRPVISRDTEDGNHPNYKQTPDGQLQRSVHGYPLCNYCGGASHKRQNCPVKMNDRAAGNNRIYHPDRDKGTSVHDKIKKQEQAKTSAAVMAPMEQQMSKLWQHNPWPNPWPQQSTAAVTYQAPMNSHDNMLFQQQQQQLGPIGSSAATMTPSQQIKPTPCPYPTCHAVLADFNQTQAHMNQFHTIPSLARGPGAEQ